MIGHGGVAAAPCAATSARDGAVRKRALRALLAVAGLAGLALLAMFGPPPLSPTSGLRAGVVLGARRPRSVLIVMQDNRELSDDLATAPHPTLAAVLNFLYARATGASFVYISEALTASLLDPEAQAAYAARVAKSVAQHVPSSWHPRLRVLRGRSWAKLLYLWGAAPDYDRLFYIDSDAVLVDHNRSVEAFFADGHKPVVWGASPPSKAGAQASIAACTPGCGAHTPTPLPARPQASSSSRTPRGATTVLAVARFLWTRAAAAARSCARGGTWTTAPRASCNRTTRCATGSAGRGSEAVSCRTASNTRCVRRSNSPPAHHTHTADRAVV